MSDSNDDIHDDLAALSKAARKKILTDEIEDPTILSERIQLLRMGWADFTLTVLSPSLPEYFPPTIIPPALISEAHHEYEFVYSIHDYGNKLSTSKAEDMYYSGMSMCKMYYTIEKMIGILIDRLKTGGVSTETEVQISFDGYEKAQRKAFESVINLTFNVVVTNFDPGEWGERYLEIVKRLADKGYGYPPESPRDNYRKHPTPSTFSPG